jgi:hypothetical protein
VSDIPLSGQGGAFDVRITMSFPGAVLQSNGDVSGDTVEWELRFGEVNGLFAVAVASAEPGPWMPYWLWGSARPSRSFPLWRNGLPHRAVRRSLPAARGLRMGRREAGAAAAHRLAESRAWS